MTMQLATGPQGRNEHPRPAKAGVFRVEFFDGTTITTTAGNAVQAEAKACRQHSGFVRTVKIQRRAAQ